MEQAKAGSPEAPAEACTEAKMTRHQQVLQAIQAYWRENAIPPAIRTIQAVTGITSSSLVRSYYIQLEKKGAIKRIKGKPVPLEIYQSITGESSQWKTNARNAGVHSAWESTAQLTDVINAPECNEIRAATPGTQGKPNKPTKTYQPEQPSQ